MKKSLLLTLVSLLVFNAVAWGECYVLNDGGEHSMSYSNSYIYEFSTKAPGKSFLIDMYKTMSTAVGSVYLYESADKSNWTNVKEIKVGDLDKNSYKTFSCNISESARYIKVDFPFGGSYKRYFKNAKVVQSKYLRIDKTSIDFGNVLFSQQSEQTVKVSYSATSGTVTSNNSAFIVSSGTAGNADCGKFGDQNITVTFKPTTIGDFSGTVNIGGNNIAVQGKCVLPAPTLSNTAKSYTTASLSWNSVGGATGYRLYNNGSKFGEDIPSTQTSIDLTGLAMHTAYKFTITALSGSVESNPSNEVAFSTNDLAASAYINVSNASYSSVEAQWAAIPNATGYYIVSNDGVVNIFDGGTTTSGTLVGLMPNNTYTFTIYGMYGEEVSLNGKTSTAIGTKETKCPIENNFGEKEIESKGGFNWDDKYSATITTTKNQATVSFSFKTSSGAATGSEFFVQESADGSNWAKVEGWSSSSQSGSGQVTLSRGKFKFRFVYSGNFGATISNISAMQGSYLEVPETTVDFGNVAIGEKPSKDIVVNYSTMVGNVSKKGSDKFAIDKIQVGKDDCGYGKENIKVTFDASNVGQFTATVMVGSTEVTVKANVTIQVPTLTASEITYNSAKLSWNAVEGAEKYKLNLIGGNSIETTETSYVCKTLKLHSSNQFTVQAYGGGQYTDPSNVVTVNTNDLAAPQNFNVEEVSYTSIPTVWDAVEDATGYRIQNETLGTYEDVDDKTTAYLFAALNANTEYKLSVTPIYNGELSNNKASLIVKTKETPYIPVSDCEQFRDVSEKSMEAFLIGKSTDYNFGKKIYKSNVSFKAKATKAALLNTDLYAQVDGQWQKIWDESDAGISSSYKTFTAVIPDGATAVRFYNNTGSSMWRNYSELIVKKRNELTPSTELLKFGKVLIGTTETKTITLEYSNLSDMTILSEGGVAFKIEMPKTLACESGTIECKISYSPVTLDQTQQGTISLYNGLTKGIAIEGGVTPLPAANATAAATGKSAISVQWDKVSGATGYKLTCADAGINVTLPDDGSEHYSYNATGLDENTKYTFIITTMYNALENESASASATTYSTVKVEKAGAFAETTTFTLSGVEGQWNKDENSFASGSTATINASNSNVCAKFDKLTIGETEYTTLPQAFIVNAPATATIYYTAKELDAPVVTVNCGSKNSAELSWSAVECADSYTVYVNGVEAETGITATSYTATDLTPATDYTFVVKAVSGSLETASESATATTYGVIKVQVGGDATSTTDWTLTGEAGKWNETEESFEVGSNVSVLASNSDAGVIFDKIQYYGGESTINPTSITVLNASVAETWAGIYYKYNGVAKTDDGEVFQTLNDAVEYSKTHAVSEITLLADRTSEKLDVTSGSNITINGQGFKIGDVTVESDAKLTTSGTLIIGDLNIKTEYRNSGEVDPKDDNLQVTGKASFDKILDPSGKVNSSMWYAVCVPFEVDIKDICGVYDDGTEKPFTYGYNYIIDEYDGAKRAASGKGWLDMDGSGTLLPGKMYIIIADINTIRFYKKSSAPIVSPLTHITLNEFAASDVRNQGWNALGNSQIFHVDIASGTEYAQVLKNGSTVYETVRLADESFAVAAPLFIQYNGGSTDVTLSKKTNGSLRSTYAENNTFNLRIASTEMSYDDQLFLTASETASADYIIGKDLIKMGDVTGVDVARIWLNAKDAKLSVMDALLFDGATEIPLGISAPKAGNYTLRLNESADRKTLELVKNGEIIHNFADGEFEMALTKGSNSGYSLRVAVDKDAPLPTDTEETNGITAYINDGVLYINGLNEGAEFSVIAESKVIAKGKANGGIEKITVPTQGLCVVISNGTTIKLMNIK